MDRIDFENLIKINKHFVKEFKTPRLNSKDNKLILLGEDNREYYFDYQYGTLGKFYVEISTSNAKQKWQIRKYDEVRLIRVDINSRHMYLDGKISKNHIHIYYPEGLETYELEEYDPKLFQSLKINDVLLDFFRLCNINDKTNVIFQEGI